MYSLTNTHSFTIGADPDAFDFSNEKPIQKTNNPNIMKMLEKASQAKRDGNEEGIQQSINYMGNTLTHLLTYSLTYLLTHSLI